MEGDGMQNRINRFRKKFTRGRGARRKLSILLALALVVTSGVGWQCELTGMALEEEYEEEVVEEEPAGEEVTEEEIVEEEPAGEEIAEEEIDGEEPAGEEVAEEEIDGEKPAGEEVIEEETPEEEPVEEEILEEEIMEEEIPEEEATAEESADAELSDTGAEPGDPGAIQALADSGYFEYWSSVLAELEEAEAQTAQSVSSSTFARVKFL